ncbi:MAG: polysulfide reductase NrfD [Melioribacteraceae bacterium]|nr:polysulfide reductase NrfD [Melioribacteraceae bacterium]
MNNESTNSLSHAEIENDLIKNIHWSTKSKIWISTLLVAFAVCLYFYVTQLIHGLGVTGLHDYASWGIYISNFVFFVAVSLVGMLISSILGLANVTWIKPISRIAEIIAVSFALVAGLVIITDMGRPDRLLNIFIHGRVQSPIVWDIAVVSTYVFVSLLLLYVPLIPDFALIGKKLTGLPKFQLKIYKVLSLGWADKPEQFIIIKKLIKILLVIIIPVAIAIHTVTSWLFALTLRPGWDSSIFGPYFVSGAFVAGAAALVIALYFYRKHYGLEKYITDEHFNLMGKVLVLVSLVYIYFNLNEVLVPGFKPGTAAGAHIQELLVGHEATLYWIVQIFGLAIPFFLLLIPMFRKPIPITIISLAIFVGAWFKRFLIVVPSQLEPYLPIQNVPEKFYQYSPTTAEIAITVGSFVLVLIIMTLISKVIPLIPIWEMKEESK